MSSHIFENEAWWQENGSVWVDEVDKRRAMQPLYGIQEVVLSSMFSNIGEKIKILEFGVGFGRHAEYLDQIPNVEFYGVDQSPTMLENLKERISNDNDIHNRITLIEPRTKLPFPDDFFDFVYTVSVLIHIQPTHLSGILSELVRVSKHGVIHFENNYTLSSELQFPDHNGCWQHSIIKEYENIGFSCELMEKVADEQDLYYTKISNRWNKSDLENKIVFSRLRLLDQRIRPNILKFEGEVGWRTQELKDRIEREFQAKEEIDRLQQSNKKHSLEKNYMKERLNIYEDKHDKLIIEINEERVQKEQYINDCTMLRSQVIYLESRLNEIETSLAWRIITKIRNMELLYNMMQPARKIVNRFRKMRQRKEVLYSHSPTPQANHGNNNEKKFNELFQKLSEIPEKSHISIHQPEWLGVTYSTKELFAFIISIKELHDNADIKYIASQISKKKVKSITFSGFAIGYYQLAKYLKELNPELSLKVFWHGNTTHMYEDYSWNRYQEIIHLINEGTLDGWGFAKESMAKLYSKKGYPSFFVRNKVNIGRDSIEKQKFITGSRMKIGVYASGVTWNKNAFTQIAAVGLIENAEVNAVPYTARMKLFAEQLNIEFNGIESAVSRDELLELMECNDINLYVTFSECAPILLLESLEMGVPCLSGPNHHYFEGTKLAEYLVINQPDNPVEIAEKAENALRNKEEIIALYKEWKIKNNELSEQSLKVFLGGEL